MNNKATQAVLLIVLFSTLFAGWSVETVTATPVPTAVNPPLYHETTVNITTDENGTVYISISGITVYNFSKTQISIGWCNISYIYVSYTGLYVDNPYEELIPVKVEIYNRSSEDNSTVLKYVFYATNFTEMSSPYANVLLKTAYYNVSGFDKIYYIVYNMTDPENPTVLYEGEISIPPESPATVLYSNQYLSYLSTLIPVALVILFAGRGSLRGIGIGLIIYGITLLALPYLGIYPQYGMYLFPIAITLGALILFFSR